MRKEIERVEERLRFDRVYLSFVNVFSFDLGHDQLDRQHLSEKLENQKIHNDWSGKLQDDFNTAEKFLLPEKFSSNIIRVSLGELKILGCPFKRFTADEYLPVEIIFTIYPDLKLASLFLCINVIDCDVDDIIFLCQTFSGGGNKFQATFPDYIVLKGFLFNSREIINAYIQKLRKAFPAKFIDSPIFFTKCIEVGKINSHQIESPRKILETFPQQLYGMLASDEGWRFVPKEAAIKKIENKWRTRNFLYVISFHRSVLFINLHESKRHDDYIQKNTLLNFKYGKLPNKYFTFFPEIGGLNHGPLLLLEFSSVQHCYLNVLSTKLFSQKKKTIQQCLKCRNELLESIRKLTWIKMREISILGQQIEESMLIPNQIENLRNMLEDVEKTLLIKYNQRTNFLMFLLTLMGAIVAICSFLFGDFNEIFRLFSVD